MKTFGHMIYGADYNPDQWLAHPEIIEEDLEWMPLANMNSATIGMFAWKELEPEEGQYCFEWLDDIMDRMAERGMKVMLGTPSGARPYWMDRDHPEVMRVSDTGVRYHHGIRHNHCLTSPYYRKKVYEIDTKLAERYQNHPALGMWHIGNEFQGECFCPQCQQAFREWLRDKYHNDIQELNEQWWTYCWSRKFSSFDEIEAPSSIGEYLIHGMNLDWRRFATAQIISFVENEIAAVRAYTPHVPVTTNLMGRSDTIDQWKLAECLDLVSIDSYPNWHVYGKTDARMAQFAAFSFDIVRSLKKDKPFYLMESTPSLVNWFDVNKIKKPGMNALSSMQAIAHGSDSVQYFQWRSARGASEKLHGTVIGHNRRTDTRVFREVAELGGQLKKLDAIVRSKTKAEIALIYDWENKWALSDLMGMTKPLDYDEICEEHYIPFWEEGTSVDIINMEHDFSEYRLLAAPLLYSIRPKVAQRLKKFVADGGILVLTFGCAYVNENDRCFMGGFPGDGLMELAGLEAEEIDALYPQEQNVVTPLVRAADFFLKEQYFCTSLCELIKLAEDTEVLAVYGSDFYEGMPAVTKHHYGKGTCYYLATRMEQNFLNEFYHQLIRENQIRKNINTTLPEGVTVQQRMSGDKVFDFILNFTKEEQRVELETGITYRDMLTNTKVDSQTVVLAPYGYRILEHTVGLKIMLL